MKTSYKWKDTNINIVAHNNLSKETILSHVVTIVKRREWLPSPANIKGQTKMPRMMLEGPCADLAQSSDLQSYNLHTMPQIASIGPGDGGCSHKVRTGVCHEGS